MRAVTVMVIAGLLLLHAVASALAAEVGDNSGAEREFVSLVAQERSSRGLSALTDDPELIEVARRHAARMAANKDLHHNPNLQTEVSNWEVLGENVGRGASVAEIHQAFMESESHRAQILEPRYLEIGVGVVWADGEIWVAEVFRKRQAQPAPAPEENQQVGATAQPAPQQPQPPASSSPAPAPTTTVATVAAPVTATTTVPAVAEATVAAPPTIDADLDGIAAALGQPVASQPGLEELAATTIASDIPLTEGVPLVVEFAAALLLLIVGMQTMTLRRLGLV